MTPRYLISVEKSTKASSTILGKRFWYQWRLYNERCLW